VTRLPPSSCAAPASEAGPQPGGTARPGAGGPARLVLWDVDHTLVSIDRVGREIYELAFAELFGRPLPEVSGVSMAGRTDRAIALEVLAVAGVTDPLTQLGQFHQIQAARAASLAGRVREHGRVLPGVPEALAAVAAGRPGVAVVQSLLTGNLRAMAEVKLGALGLLDAASPLDPDAGAYGTESETRADLVPVARRHAAARYGARLGGTDFGGAATVLVGDTPLDVEAALIAGARAVGVATGQFSVAVLTAAGAHAVLPDLTDTAQVVAAILG
jgi:phosphoglycolate phosphatase-like HAD superfamily hydrolase